VIIYLKTEAIKAGAKGVIMGRNVFGQKDPAAIVKAILGIVRENDSVKKVESNILCE